MYMHTKFDYDDNMVVNYFWEQMYACVSILYATLHEKIFDQSHFKQGYLYVQIY